MRVGSVVKNGITPVIQQVPAEGKPSKRNGKAFSCRTWVKDALAHLVARRNIVLKADVGKCGLHMDESWRVREKYPLVGLLTSRHRNTVGNGQEVRCQVRCAC